jgi:hypothetical protein
VIMVSRLVGQTTLAASARTCWINSNGLVMVTSVQTSREGGRGAQPEKLAARSLSAPRHFSFI